MGYKKKGGLILLELAVGGNRLVLMQLVGLTDSPFLCVCLLKVAFTVIVLFSWGRLISCYVKDKPKLEIQVRGVQGNTVHPKKISHFNTSFTGCVTNIGLSVSE